MAIADTFANLGTAIINLVGTRASRHLDNLSTVGLKNITSHVKDITETELNSKQDKLVSGTTIKTINGEWLLGSGNIEVATTINLTYDEENYRMIFGG